MGIIFSSFNGLEAKLPYIKFSTSQWQQKNFSDLFTILSNNTHSRAELTNYGTIRNIHYGDVLIKFGNILDTSQAEIPYLCENCKYKDEYMQDGDIIIADTAEDYTAGKCTELFNVGTSKIISGLHTIPCRPKIKFAQKYLGYYTNSPAYRHQLLSLLQGIKVYSISKTNLSNTHVSYPPLPEQQKIADFLSLVDQRIEKQRQLVESLKKYKRGLLSAIFDHKLRFKDENGNDYPEWDNFVLDNLGSFYNGLSGKNKDDFGTGNSEYITYMNVFKNTIANETICERVNILPNEHQNIVNFGDLLFTQSSETMEEVGFCSVWNSHKKVFLNSFCFGLHFNNSKFAYPQFMAHYMRSYKIRLLIMRESQGATRINLSSERLKKIELSLPPYKEQKIIAHFIERYDNTIQNEEKKLEMFNNLKQGLLQQMFI